MIHARIVSANTRACLATHTHTHTHANTYVNELTWLNRDSNPPSPMSGEPPRPQCPHPTMHGFLKFTNVQLMRDMPPPPGPLFMGSMMPFFMGPPTSVTSSNSSLTASHADFMLETETGQEFEFWILIKRWLWLCIFVECFNIWSVYAWVNVCNSPMAQVLSLA